MTILLTGGAGYIGTHTIIELDKAGHSVVVVDNLINSNPESLRRVAKIIGKEIPFYEVDVRDKDNLSKVFDENKIDAVIHFAGLKAVGESAPTSLSTSKKASSSKSRTVQEGIGESFQERITK